MQKKTRYIITELQPEISNNKSKSENKIAELLNLLYSEITRLWRIFKAVFTRFSLVNIKIIFFYSFYPDKREL